MKKTDGKTSRSNRAQENQTTIKNHVLAWSRDLTVFLAVVLVACVSMAGDGGVSSHVEAAAAATGRVVCDFDGDWQFCNIRLDRGKPVGHSFGESWESQFTTEHVAKAAELRPLDRASDWQALTRQLVHAPWQDATLPHTPVIEDRVVKVPVEAITFYRKRFIPSPRLRGKCITLAFDGVMQRCDVWLNGQHVDFHAGGYMGFSIDLTDKLRWENALNELIVRTDNREHPLVPPGKPQNRLDFCYHPGIYRSVRLVGTDAVHISDPLTANIVAGGGVFVTYPEVSAGQAVVRVQTDVRNDSDRAARVPVSVHLYPARSFSAAEMRNFLGKGETNVLAEVFAQVHRLSKIDLGRAVAEGYATAQIGARTNSCVTVDLAVARPALWHPDTPNLYRLEVVAGTDRQVLLIGIRTFAVSPDKGLLINGRPFHFQGANRHMEYPWIGNALSNEAQWRDAVLLKRGGFDFVRLAHYPQSPVMYDACDALGLLVADAVPGWQYFNSHPTFRDYAFRDVREMVRRDRNHACVLLWEASLNESNPPIEFRRRQAAIVHEEYPGALTSGDTTSLPLDLKDPVWDVAHTLWFCRNGVMGRPNDVQPQTVAYHREYGHYEFGGNKSTSNVRRDEGERKLLELAWNHYWETNLLRKDIPWSIGECIWEGFDHNRGGEPTVSTDGAFDLLRLPKFAVDFFRTQRDVSVAGEQLEIASFWTENEPKKNRKVVVFSNAEEVELVLNGKVLARQKPDGGPDTEHTQLSKKKPLPERWDGGNCRHLRHPAFTFNQVPCAAGELKAVAYRAGRGVATRTVRTAGKPSQIRLLVDLAGIPAAPEGNDPIFVRADLLDAEGNLVYAANGVAMKFSVEFPWEIVSPAEVKTEAGTASVLVRRIGGLPAGELKVRAETTTPVLRVASELLPVK